MYQGGRKIHMYQFKGMKQILYYLQTISRFISK